MATSELPTRSNTVKTDAGYISDEEAVPTGDPSSSTGLLAERLQAWKHMCGYLENYISEVAKQEKSEAKDQEKILKTLSNPLKEGHHFDQAIGGIAGLFENLRANTQAQANLHTETSKSLTGSVLPILTRLHAEIKNKSKELASGAGKGAKSVDSARNTSQKHIELLGQYTATFDAAGGRVTAHNDPYVLERGVYHRLNKQILEENNNRQDLIAVQNSFQQFEAHVLTTVQTALNSFHQYMAGQAERQKAMFGDIAATASNIPHDFEWNGFMKRSGHMLVNPNAAPRSMDTVSFPNQGHRATKPLIEGSLERKPRGLGAIKGYTSGYYAVTPAGYLHEFKDNDNFHKDPLPETSLYLPDCIVGAVDGVKFTIKGKDSSGGKLGQKMAMTAEFQFKAHTPADAQQWHSIIASKTSATSTSAPSSTPTSPVESRKVTPIMTNTEQQQGVTSATQTPVSAAPQSAVSTTATPQTATASTPATTMSPVSGKETHYHGAPAATELEERKYVEEKTT